MMMMMMMMREKKNLSLVRRRSNSQRAAQNADVAEFAQPLTSSFNTAPKQPAPRIKGQSMCHRDEGPEAKWEFEIKPLDETEVHYPEKQISHLKTSVPKEYISK